jgi:hypothetical protein
MRLAEPWFSAVALAVSSYSGQVTAALALMPVVPDETSVGLPVSVTLHTAPPYPMRFGLGAVSVVLATSVTVAADETVGLGAVGAALALIVTVPVAEPVGLGADRFALPAE